MERACFEENEARFSQTDGTLPMNAPTLDDLGYLGDTNLVEEILIDNYVAPPDKDPYMQELIQAMHMPSSISKTITQSGPISMTLSLQ
jgi:hypothetical protein